MSREKAWAVAIARQVSEELPEAVRLAQLRLTGEQVELLRKALEHRLIETMGEDSDEAPRKAATRIVR
jgi:hypothetical protein